MTSLTRNTTLVTLAQFANGGEAAYARYAQGVLPLLGQYGAKVRERLRGGESLVGDQRPDLVAVLEFPNSESLRTFLHSPEYRLLIPHRDQAFQQLQSFECESF